MKDKMKSSTNGKDLQPVLWGSSRSWKDPLRRPACTLLALALAVTPCIGLASVSVASATEAPITAEPCPEPAYGHDLLDAIDAADFKGSDIVIRYLLGEEVTYEELASVDIEALAEIDPAIARGIEVLLNTPPDANGTFTQIPSNKDAASGAQGADPAMPNIADPQTSQNENASSTDPARQTESESATNDAQSPEASDVRTPESADQNAPTPGMGGSSAEDANASDPQPPAQDAPEANDAEVYPEWSYSGDTSYIPKHYSQDLETEEFIAVVGEQARQIGQERGLYASVMIAQAILESGSGNSALAREGNNLFGIKGSYQGQSVNFITGEDDGTGSNYYIRADFRAYPSIRESLEDYADLLRDGLDGFYAPAWKENADSFVMACNYLEGRYATDTSYSEKLQDLIETYDLTRYDDPISYELVEPIMVEAVDPETGKTLLDEAGDPVMEERTLTDLVAEATSHLGVPYVWGGTTPAGFDCSGLIQYSFEKALNVKLPRTTYYQCTLGEDVDFADLQMGDLLFFETDGTVGHVGMYLADGFYIEAPHSGDVVCVTALEDKMPDFAKRVLPTKPAGTEAAGELGKLTLPDGLELERESEKLIHVQLADEVAESEPLLPSDALLSPDDKVLLLAK